MDYKLARNAAWSLVEVGVSSVALFLIYRLVTVNVGVRALGIWSLVLATTSLARFGDLGATAGLGRLVAIADRTKGKSATDYVETAVVTTLLIYAAMSLILYLPVQYALGRALDGADLKTALDLLPFAALSFVLTMTASGVTTGLIGQHRADQKSQLGIAALLLQLAVALLFIKRHGLLALAWAQISQNLLMLAGGWFLVLRNENSLALRLPYRWRRAVLGELFGFGLRLQAANLLNFSFEPLTKFVMTSFGGLEALGLYEMANRMVLQVRQLIVAPVQILTPAFAAGTDQPDVLRHLYDRALAVVLALAVSATGALILAAPIVSIVWLGHFDSLFIVFAVVLSLAWLCNILAAPAYLLGVGTGIVGGNILGHVVTSLGGPLLSAMLGLSMHAVGVTLGAAVMLAAGSLLSMVLNCRRIGLRPLGSAGSFRLARQQFWARLRLRLSGTAA